MKKVFLSILTMISVLCACEKSDCTKCNESDTTKPETKTELKVSLDFSDSDQTKAVTAYVGSRPYETKVNKVQVLVFDSEGRLNAYKNVGATTSASISVSYGNKKVWAVVNGPDLSNIATESALQSKAVSLSDNNTTESIGFVMAGSTSCSVSSSSVTASITVSRLVSRVVVQKINNQLPSVYGTITIERVMLTNVVGNQNINGTAAISTWHNLAGRKDGATSSSEIINGTSVQAAYPTLTFSNLGANINNGSSFAPSSPYMFYGYPNSTTGDHAGFSSNMAARKTRVVVVATVGGTTYYYPVSINTPERNKTYTVELTIAGLGSPDPDKPVIKGSINANVSVQGWIAGANYEETI